MKDSRLKYIYVIMSVISVLVVSCISHQRYPFSGLNKHSEFPEGVDSLVVAQSDSIINYLFVDFANEQKANELTREAQFALNQADSIWQGLKKIKSDSLSFPVGVASDSSSTVQQEFSISIKKVISDLQTAERDFQQAIRLNPFPLVSKDGLAQTYMLWAEIEKPEIYYEKAATTLTELIGKEKSEHLLFYKLGECYFSLGKWDRAFSNYHQAEKIFLATKGFSDSTVFENLLDYPHKDDLYFNYLYSQAVSLARMYKAQEALVVINHAKEVAPTRKLKELAERFEDWINWDNGNIYTAEQKNQILKLIAEGKYGDAASKFESLKNQLLDPLAIDEIEWRISTLEFSHLNKKKEACERLLQVIHKNKNASYYPPHLISNYNQYVSDCGIMHFYLAMDFIEKADYKQAHKYFEQGAKIDWDGSYKCQLELAKLNKHNPQTSLDIIDKVLQDPSGLSVTEKLSALEIKLSALRKLGPQFHEKAQQTYQQIRELQKK